MARVRKALTATALGAAAFALIAAAAGTTGAYFSDSHDGTINSSTGAVKVDTSDLSLNFAKQLPGVFQTQDVTFTARGSSTEDIWLVFPTSPESATAYLNGKIGTAGEEPALGRYGHFAVSSPAGSFSSFNLTTAEVPSAADCGVNANGHGGSDVQAVAEKVGYPPYCPVPNAILLSDNLASGVTQTAKLTFGYTTLLKEDAYQNSPTGVVAPFRIVATQHGILPTDVNNVVR